MAKATDIELDIDETVTAENDDKVEDDNAAGVEDVELNIDATVPAENEDEVVQDENAAEVVSDGESEIPPKERF